MIKVSPFNQNTNVAFRGKAANASAKTVSEAPLLKQVKPNSSASRFANKAAVFMLSVASALGLNTVLTSAHKPMQQSAAVENSIGTNSVAKLMHTNAVADSVPLKTFHKFMGALGLSAKDSVIQSFKVYDSRTGDVRIFNIDYSKCTPKSMQVNETSVLMNEPGADSVRRIWTITPDGEKLRARRFMTDKTFTERAPMSSYSQVYSEFSLDSTGTVIHKNSLGELFNKYYKNKAGNVAIEYPSGSKAEFKLLDIQYFSDLSKGVAKKAAHLLK